MTQFEKQTLINEQESIILDRQAKLKKSDYAAAKIAEGAASVAEYSSLLEIKQGWRNDINAAETEIARLRAIEPDEERMPEEGSDVPEETNVESN